MKKKAYVDKKMCVACGCCLAVCKVGAVSIPDGVCAIIDFNKCVGCGMCVQKCPASVVSLEVISNE